MLDQWRKTRCGPSSSRIVAALAAASKLRFRPERIQIVKATYPPAGQPLTLTSCNFPRTAVESYNHSGGRVAQLVEQCPFKAWVAGSNPAALTIILNNLLRIASSNCPSPQPLARQRLDVRLLSHRNVAVALVIHAKIVQVRRCKLPPKAYRSWICRLCTRLACEENFAQPTLDSRLTA